MRQALPVAELRSFVALARRTAALRGLLALLVATLVALAYLSFGRLSEAAAVPAGRGSTVVVIDLSGSISDAGYHTVRTALDGLIRRGGKVGLVLFSDVAEEALPPGSAASELQPFSRALAPRPINRLRDGPLNSDSNPWTTTFSGGTDISSGLALARKTLDEAGGGRVLLLSDLADGPEDRPVLRTELLAYARDSVVRLQVVPLPGAAPGDEAVYRRFLGPTIQPAASTQLFTPVASHPPSWRLLAALGALALVLAAAELLVVPLAWRSPRGAS